MKAPRRPSRQTRRQRPRREEGPEEGGGRLRRGRRVRRTAGHLRRAVRASHRHEVQRELQYMPEKEYVKAKEKSKVIGGVKDII